MGKITKCPECGKLIAIRFPVHNCTPAKKEKEIAKRIWHQKSSRPDKINWLLNHQHLWEGWGDIADTRKEGIVKLMIKDGLVSEKTYWPDVNLTRLIYEARAVRRSVIKSVKKEKK